MGAKALHRLTRSRFFRQVATVAGGTAFAQVITVAVAPVITRLYAPQALGVLGVFVSLVAVLSAVSALGYHGAVVIPRDHGEGWALVRLSVYASAAVALVLTIVLALARETVAGWLGFAAPAVYLLLVPVAVLAAALVKVLSEWCGRLERFDAVAGASVTHSLVSNVGKVGLGFLWPTGPVLIAVITATHAVKAVLLAVVGLRARPAGGAPAEASAGASADSVGASADSAGASADSPGASADSAVSAAVLAERSGNCVGHAAPGRGAFALALSYGDFPALYLPNTFFNRLGQNAPIVLLAALFGPAAAGFYELARRIIKLPSQLLAKSVGRVYRQRAAKAMHAGRSTTRDFLRTIALLLGAGVLPFGVVIAFGPAFFGVVFGTEWVTAGEFARWLAVWYLLHVAISPARQVIRVARRLATKLWWSIGANATKLGAMAAVAVTTGSALFSVIAYALVAIVSEVVLVLLAVRASHARASDAPTEES